MTLHDTIGYAAAALTTASFVPQAVLTVRTRNVAGISLGMYGLFTLSPALVILVTKLRYGRKTFKEIP